MLIEHGNRFDAWNAVPHGALRRLRSQLSRRLPTAPDFPALPGSRLVVDVMNPLKKQYPFIDLLQRVAVCDAEDSPQRQLDKLRALLQEQGTLEEEALAVLATLMSIPTGGASGISDSTRAVSSSTATPEAELLAPGIGASGFFWSR